MEERCFADFAKPENADGAAAGDIVADFGKHALTPEEPVAVDGCVGGEQIPPEKPFIERAAKLLEGTGGLFDLFLRNGDDCGAVVAAVGDSGIQGPSEYLR